MRLFDGSKRAAARGIQKNRLCKSWAEVMLSEQAQHEAQRRGLDVFCTPEEEEIHRKMKATGIMRKEMCTSRVDGNAVRNHLVAHNALKNIHHMRVQAARQRSRLLCEARTPRERRLRDAACHGGACGARARLLQGDARSPLREFASTERLPSLWLRPVRARPKDGRRALLAEADRLMMRRCERMALVVHLNLACACRNSYSRRVT